MEELDIIGAAQKKIFELPFNTVSIVGGNFDEFFELYKNAKDALNKLNGFKLQVQYGATREP